MTQNAPAETIRAPREALLEALDLSTEILRDLELQKVPLSAIALKACRLARLLNDTEMHKILAYEASGYPSSASGVAPDIYRLAVAAGRESDVTDPVTKQVSRKVSIESIDSMEHTIRVAEASLTAARDPDVCLSSSNPNQVVYGPQGNQIERLGIRNQAAIAARLLGRSRSLIYQYVLARHYTLKFSGVADDVFTRTRLHVDQAIAVTMPEAARRFTSVYDNLRSENPEDWSNAAHSCRRILQDLADIVFPATDESRALRGVSDGRPVKLGRDQYVNRILAFVQENASSETYAKVVGSHIRFLTDRLHAVREGAQKGSHDVVTREEAEKYVLYTYLLLGDILSVRSAPAAGSAATAPVDGALLEGGSLGSG